MSEIPRHKDLETLISMGLVGVYTTRQDFEIIWCTCVDPIAGCEMHGRLKLRDIAAGFESQRVLKPFSPDLCQPSGVEQVFGAPAFPRLGRRAGETQRGAGVRQFCHKKLKHGAALCLRFKEHDGEHSTRQDAEEPPLDKMLLILETAEDTTQVWARVWTFSNGGWMTWLTDQGLLIEDQTKYPEIGFYYGPFSWSTMAPDIRITDKGKALLAEHVKVEW